MTTKSRKMALVALIVCSLPAFAAAKTVVFGSCVNGIDLSDKLMQTQEGINQMNLWSDMKLVAWHKDAKDGDTSCHSLSVSNNELTLECKYKDQMETFGGTVEVVHVNGKNNYIDVNTNKIKKFPKSTFGSGDDGKIKMYVHLLYETEIALMTCRNGWLACYYQFYVFSNNDYSHLDPDCLLETCEKMDNFNMELAPPCE